MLHMRNRGTNRVRAKDNVRSRLGDQVSSLGKEQIYRPKKSPRPKTKKWIELKRRECMDGFVDATEVVMGGNTA